VDSAASVRLLARAVRARRLALVAAGEERSGVRLRAVLGVDGAVAARALREPSGDLESASRAVLRELLVLGDVVEPAPSILESPWLWIGLVAAAGAAAALTGALLYDPGTQTTVSFRPPGGG
jgi:hypothetical protein